MVIERINISMPSRFGKSMTANMLTAYYSSGAYFYKWSSICGATTLLFTDMIKSSILLIPGS
ncbi:hypothetical protein DXA02_10415 [Ruminococcus sp. AM54-1NS]|nr:hypothetical protein DXA02_10415 [Ruminococcus sp. AM54-1NS]